MVRRRLGIESLERRLLMAGDVTAALKGGWLVVTGDAEANQVLIQNPSPGEYSVTGADGTTVTGSPVTGVTKGIKVNLKDGDNTVAIVGSGGETFHATGDVKITTGKGNDRILVAGLQADGKVTLSSGNATGEVAFDQVLVTDSEFDKNLSVKTGSGHDWVGIGQGDPLDDMLSDFLDEMGWDGLGIVPGDVDVTGKLSVATGNGDDSLMICNSDIDGSASVNTGGGTDDCLVRDTTVDGAASVNMGGGNDDYLGIQDTDVAGRLTLNGGAGGGDTLEDLGGNFYPFVRPPKGFEFIV